MDVIDSSKSTGISEAAVELSKTTFKRGQSGSNLKRDMLSRGEQY